MFGTGLQEKLSTFFQNASGIGKQILQAAKQTTASLREKAAPYIDNLSEANQEIFQDLSASAKQTKAQLVNWAQNSEKVQFAKDVVKQTLKDLPEDIEALENNVKNGLEALKDAAKNTAAFAGGAIAAQAESNKMTAEALKNIAENGIKINPNGQAPEASGQFDQEAEDAGPQASIDPDILNPDALITLAIHAGVTINENEAKNIQDSYVQGDITSRIKGKVNAKVDLADPSEALQAHAKNAQISGLMMQLIEKTMQANGVQAITADNTPSHLEQMRRTFLVSEQTNIVAYNTKLSELRSAAANQAKYGDPAANNEAYGPSYSNIA